MLLGHVDVNRIERIDLIPRSGVADRGGGLCERKPCDSLTSRDDGMKLTKSPKLEAFGVGPVESLDLATPAFASDERVPQQSG